MNNEILLTTKNVSVAFRIDGRFYNAVYKMSLDVHRGEVLAIVGESGSGKSTFATAIMALHNPKQTKITGSIKLEGEEIVGKVGDQMATIRGKKKLA